MFQCFFYRILSYFMEDNAFRFFQTEHFRYMPCDSFAFSVRISGQVNIVSFLGAGSQLLDYFFLILIYFITGNKTAPYINSVFFAFWQIAYVAYRRANRKVLVQKF